VNEILKGQRWPDGPEDRDVLYFLVVSFRNHLIKNLPQDARKASAAVSQLALTAKDKIRELTTISLEMAQLVLGTDEQGEKLPNWFVMELIRDLPRLTSKT
jgi:hypothetical protein